MEEPMSRLTPDLIVEILGRVPYKSLCICKRVCPAWRDLIADPANRKKVVQSLAGFFYHTTDGATADSAERRGHAVNYADLSASPWSHIPPTHPRLPLPPDCADRFFSVEDSRDGLFLSRIRTGAPAGNFRYMVSNPATSEYTLLPHSGYDGRRCASYLGFDSIVSTEEFHVFEGVRIYSSKTGAWVAMKPQWHIKVSLCAFQPGVFRKGCLHLLMGMSGIAIVDAEGLKWTIIRPPTPENSSFSGFIGKSAGQLFYIDAGGLEGSGTNAFSTVSVYVPGVDIYPRDVIHLDGKSVHWKLLHKLSNVVAPKKMFQLGFDLEVIGVHPHSNMIFFIAHWSNELIAYDLDHHESTVVYHIEPNYKKFRPFFPYVPLLFRLPLDGAIRLATPN
ncbi:hypothetical protein VPH35_139898 [Triticum aestivum]